MKKFVFMAGAALALSFPSAAMAGNPYAGVEFGLSKGRGNDVDQTIDYSTVQSPATPAAPAGPADVFFDDVFAVSYKRGTEIAANAGYDFGWFRTELELGHKRAGLKRIASDDITAEFLSSLNAGLNRPSASPDAGAPGLAQLTIDDFALDGSLKITTLMANGMFDVGLGKGVAVFAGGGYGRSFGKALGDSDKAWAWQYMAGLRVPVTDALDVGLKYRYFNSGVLKLVDDGFSFAGNPDRLAVPVGAGTTDVDRTTSAIVSPDIEGRYRSRSLSLTLTYNFGR